MAVDGTERGEELLAWIYADSEERHAEPEPGVLVGCTVWLSSDCGGNAPLLGEGGEAGPREADAFAGKGKGPVLWQTLS